MASQTTLPDSLSSFHSLSRARACKACRRRKLKCDGRRPFCTQCQKSKIDDDCEYDDGVHKSHSRRLIEQIKQLESRIRQLESGASPASAENVRFQHLQSWDSDVPSCLSSMDAVSAKESDSTTTPHQSSPLTYWFPQHWSNGDPSPAVPLSLAPLSTPPDIPQEVFNQLLSCFLPHRNQVGMRMAIPQLTELICNNETPHRALVYSMCLWGCHFSSDLQHKQLEAQLLSAAIYLLTMSLRSQERLVDTVRATALIALYLICNCRLLEGRYHANAAVSVALKSQLHKLGSSRPSDMDPFATANSPIFQTTCGTNSTLTPRSNLLEWYNNSQAFWQVFYLDRCWSVAIGLPHALSEREGPQSRIDTPWPMEMDELAQTHFVPSLDTLQSLYREDSSIILPQSSLLVRAATLFERGSSHATSWPETQKDNQWWATYNEIAMAIDRLTDLIPEPEALKHLQEMDIERSIELITASCLTHAAAIHLRAPIAASNLSFCAKSLTAINNMVAVIERIPDVLYQYLDPILGTCWLSALGVLLRHRTNLSMVGATPSAFQLSEHQGKIVFTAMGKLSTWFPLVAHLTSKAEGLFFATNAKI